MRGGLKRIVLVEVNDSTPIAVGATVMADQCLRYFLGNVSLRNGSATTCHSSS